MRGFAMPPFTVSQAEALIPLIQKEMAVLLPSYHSLKSLWEETTFNLGKEPDDPEVRDSCLNDIRAIRSLRQIESSLSFFAQLGVECRGIEDGIFEFPCLVWDRLVLLSWQLHDEQIAFWHEVDVDYAERRPLIDLAPMCVQDERKEVIN